jgi:ribose 5-phosphate isomerase B
MKIALASDHAGFRLKKIIAEQLAGAGHSVEDFGCPSEAAADVSDHVAPAAEALGAGRFDRAIFVDGAGYPSGIVANMFHGVYAAVCNDTSSAKLAREHGGANALCLGAMIVGELVAKEIVRLFIATEPLGGKYEARREKVRAIGDARRLGPLFRTRKVITIEDLRGAIERKEPLILDENTIITPSVMDAVRAMRA